MYRKVKEWSPQTVKTAIEAGLNGNTEMRCVFIDDRGGALYHIKGTEDALNNTTKSIEKDYFKRVRHEALSVYYKISIQNGVPLDVVLALGPLDYDLLRTRIKNFSKERGLSSVMDRRTLRKKLIQYGNEDMYRTVLDILGVVPETHEGILCVSDWIEEEIMRR